MTKASAYTLQADMLRALGNPLRLEVIELLRGKELCFTDILEVTGGLKSTLSQHLSVLTRAGILKSRRKGQCVYFSLSTLKVAKACQLIQSILRENHRKTGRVLG